MIIKYGEDIHANILIRVGMTRTTVPTPAWSAVSILRPIASTQSSPMVVNWHKSTSRLKPGFKSGNKPVHILPAMVDLRRGHHTDVSQTQDLFQLVGSHQNHGGSVAFPGNTGE